MVLPVGSWEVWGGWLRRTSDSDPRLDHEEHVRVGDQVQFDLSHFQGYLKRIGWRGRGSEAVEAVRSQHGLSKSLETVSKAKLPSSRKSRGIL